MYSPSDGIIRLSNAAATDFTRLQFGGTTSSFPALKRSSISLQARLADDSGFTFIQSAGFYMTNGSSMSDTADGIIRLQNNAGTGFTCLNLGGSTSSFPSIKRNSAAINFRLADDSADAAITAATITTTGGGAFGITTANAVSPTSPNRTITITLAGTTYYLAAKTTND
jgi:hypothetical protein